MYNAEDLSQAFRQRPYSPIDLQLSSGERITLTHPEQAVVTDTDGVMVFQPGRREGTVAWRLIGLDRIVRVQPSNGSKVSERAHDESE